MSSFGSVDDEAPGCQITRALDIGLEILPKGVTALDFIKYDKIPLQRPELYPKDGVVPHILFGENTEIRPELLEEDPIEHSELWLKIITKLHPELVPSGKVKLEDQEKYLPFHAVHEPTLSRPLPSLLLRKSHYNISEERSNMKRTITTTRVNTGMLNSQALEKLKQTINWLNYCEEEETIHE